MPPRYLAKGGRTLGQWIIGTMVGASFSIAAVRTGLPYIPVLLILVVFTAGLCLLNGWLLQRWAGVDATTGFLGSLPGTAAASVALASDLKADPFMVVILMYIRVLLIMTLIPLILSPWIDRSALASGTAATRDFVTPTPMLIVLSILMTLTAARLAEWARIPSGNYLGPFILFLLLKAFRPEWTLGFPAATFNGGMLLLGMSVGTKFDLARLRASWKPACIQVGLVLGLLVACLGAAMVFHRLTDADFLTAVLCTTPGGKESMVAFSIEIGGNVELVIVMQTVRWLLVMFFGPAIVIWMTRKQRSNVPQLDKRAPS